MKDNAGFGDARLRIHVGVTKPVHLKEFALAFMGVQHEFNRVLGRSAYHHDAEDVETDLYLTKIEEGSIVAELAIATVIVGQHIPVDFALVIGADFIQHIKDVIDWCAEKGRKKDADISSDEVPYTKNTLENIQSICQLAAQNGEGQLGIKSIEYKAEEKKVHLDIGFLGDTLSDAVVGAKRAGLAIEQKSENDFKRVALAFQRGALDKPSSSGNSDFRGVIQSLWSKDLKVYIISEMDKQRIESHFRHDSINPFLSSYIVDVNVQLNPKGNPVAYRVMHLHDIIPHEEDDNSALI